MSRKLLIIFVAVVMGVFMTSLAMAQHNVGEWGELAYKERELKKLPAAGASAATVLNPEGLGDTLIFPYYDVRVVGGKTQDFYFAIINETLLTTTYGGIAAKLRFREWDKSEEVFDADIWLSCNDVWIGVLTRDAVSGLTKITSSDWVILDSLTTPGSFILGTPLSGGFSFFTTYVPTPPVTTLTKADLTNMGYFEVIGEEKTYCTQTASKVTRLPAGVNPDCPNWLAGYAYVVRKDDGASHGYNATAIANFYRDGTLFVGPGDVLPNLNSCQDGLDSLEAQIAKANISQGFSIEEGILAKFSMIVTFPTKHFHFFGRPSYTLKNFTLGSPGVVPSLPFTGAHMNYGELIRARIYDRLEGLYTPEIGWWSPRTTPTLSLPHEVTIVGLYKSTVPTLPAPDERNTMGLITGGFETGWLWIDLTGGDNSHLANPYTLSVDGLAGPYWWQFFDETFDRYYGLPATPLAFQEFTNLAVGGYYGSIFPAFYEIDWRNFD